MGEIALQEKLFTVHCASCGMLFALTKDFEERRRADHKQFFCPSGHSNHWDAETDVEKARRERDVARQQIARIEDEKREAIAAKDREIATMRKRSAAGVCPCCNRSFSELRRHMQTKHPKFIAENVVPMGRKKTA